MTREDFIKEIGPMAKELSKEYNLLPSLICGVACHESNFGSSGLAEKSNNLFSIKGEYKGDSVTFRTWEVYNGQRVDVDAKFRKYPSYKESMEDFCKLIHNGVSWNKALYHSVIGVKDWKDVIVKFADTPYMTDPDYEGKLMNITEKYKLYEFNEESDKGSVQPENDETAETAPDTEPDTAPEEEQAQTPTETPETAQDEETEGIQYIEYPGRTFTLGSGGNYVRMIQERLNHGLAVDGVFGPITRSYVMVFQNEKKLHSIDGIVGPETWDSLFNK